MPLIRHLLRTASDERFAVHAYCFMPDHVHLLVEGTTAVASLPAVVTKWKQRTSFEWKSRTATPLWQRGYMERVLRTEDDTAVAVRYVLGNPVRVGLVADFLDYPFLGSATMDVADLARSAQ